MTAYDELQLDTLGDKKTALFLIMSDTDATFNFLISMIYTQLFNLLCEKADDVYGGRLPVHVRCLIDEMANIGQIPNLEKLVATIRSREISACLVLQAQSQLKAIYKDNADTIIGNMDSRIFLGGSEPTTLKELNQALGKETIDTYNTSNTRGNSPSYGLNYQKLGKDLASVDELAVLDKEKQNTDLILSEGEAVRTKVRDNIELDLLCRNQPESAPVMQEIYELVVETIQLRSPVLRLGSNLFPMALVRERLLQLTSEHIRFVLDGLRNLHTDVKNLKKYLLTMLFNAPVTLNGRTMLDVRKSVNSAFRPMLA